MLSGIGDKGEIEKHNIECIHNLPTVGKNLHDHFMMPLRFNLKQGSNLKTANGDNCEKMPTSIPTLLEFLLYGTGLITTSALDAYLFYNTGVENHHIKKDMVDAQIGLFASAGNGDLYDKNMNVDNIYENYIPESKLNDSSEGFLLIPTVLHPLSRGYVTLNSSNPLDKPLIDQNFLDNYVDVKTLIESSKKAVQIVNEYPLSQYLEDPNPMFPPALIKKYNGVQIDNDQFWEDMIRMHATHVYHPVSTCAMGSVLDSDCKVLGIKNLRVADCSSFPHITSGNTNAPAILIGEIVSDFIKKEYNLNSQLETGRNLEGIITQNGELKNKMALSMGAGIIAAVAGSLYTKSKL